MAREPGIVPAEFQSTPSRRGRLFGIDTVQVFLCFNPLPHAEGDALEAGIIELAQDVSIHSLTQRETIRYRGLDIATQRFNPLPHAEGDFVERQSVHPLSVSIHSLTQRETSSRQDTIRCMCVSIHSLTQRETYAADTAKRFCDVSIHSLTQRET